jgi:hypothetical protein
MFEWRVNQIRLSMMERVLNHMEKQGFEVQTILPIPSSNADNCQRTDKEPRVVLAGKKLVGSKPLASANSMPSVNPNNLDSVFGRSSPQ